ncbi:DUF4175 domain-containing protein [Nakamurella flava]|uniref:DUF4175 domain-containing protein n=1 Tax=Nakamurella flava TaxID=2576308 RepID=A0A4U6Q6Y8_9ACTN|nr:DUF4175 domain-containing protein [Nakamurella flava]TKV56159.1 DUF4175 domain-containing protein [Nakamurella flava]
MEQLQRWFIRWPIGMGIAFGVVLGGVVFLLSRGSGTTGSLIGDGFLPLCLTGGAIASALLGDRRRGGPFEDRLWTGVAGVIGLALAGFGGWLLTSTAPALLGALLIVVGLAVVVLCVDRARRWERP